MWKNYLKTTLRSLRRHSAYSFINVGGLGLGLACCFLIVLFIQHELSFDRFHEKTERIYRLIYTQESSDEIKANSAAGYKPLIEGSMPEVEHIIRTEDFRDPYLRLPDGTVQRTGGLWLVDPSLGVYLSAGAIRPPLWRTSTRSC